ncbi:MAG: bifunctional glutamine-synthetase adenylyltransferase/deadenyltransferase, partial [Actinomycetales bacterium]|nr:bifunctional glutamine-synthetase adenylyltransferase/deadenyltransferase [Actinomycetales bacterium]
MATSRAGVGARVASGLAKLGHIRAATTTLVENAADVDACLGGLESLVDVEPNLFALTAGDERWLPRLVAALGESRAVADFWCRHPEHLTDLAEESELSNLRAEAELRQFMLGATSPAELRISYQRFLAVITALDATGEIDFVTVSQLLADIAVATLDAALQIARSNEPDADSVRLAIMAMGKTGGRELNYISDVDVIFVHDVTEGFDDHKGIQVAARLATAVITMCGEHSAEGTIWEV